MQSVTGQQIDDGLFHGMHQPLRAVPTAFKIDQKINDELTRAVVRHIAAAVAVDQRDAVDMGACSVTAFKAHGKHRRMLQQPNFVIGRRRARVRECLHGAKGFAVVHYAKLAQRDRLMRCKFARTHRYSTFPWQKSCL